MEIMKVHWEKQETASMLTVEDMRQENWFSEKTTSVYFNNVMMSHLTYAFRSVIIKNTFFRNCVII